MYFFLILIIIIIFIIIFKNFKNNRENFYVGPSKINGVGVHTFEDIPHNTILFKAIDRNNKITQLGSKVNHCHKPNTKLVEIGDSWFLISTKNLKNLEELTADYNDTPDFVKKPNPNWTC